MPLAWLKALAARVVRTLGIRQGGVLPITFVDSRTMRVLNRRFTRHRGLTDVLSFRYPHELIVGEILIAPAAARRYGAQHDLPYRQELARYVLHGLLHWLGYDDQTPRQQRRMRETEDALLTKCLK